MRRIVLVLAALLLAAMLITLPAIGSNGHTGTYEVRGIFDNGSFMTTGEQVRIAGATVGTVKSIDVTGNYETASLEGGPHAVPGKAVVVMEIDDSGFKDFRDDASCIVRPQSLIGERYVDCTPTQPRAPGTPLPPELAKVPDGEPGAGQYLLPLENNGKTVDLDLIQNINRLPYRDRFRLILNDLGAGLAARGDDLGQVIDRANPALRQTDRVLHILAQQNRQLASLASNGDQVLQPLAENRQHITGFFRNAAISGSATAERGADLQLALRRFPETLHQIRLTMAKLRNFTDQGVPLATDLNKAAPGLSKATVNLPAFATNSIPALQTLGAAAQTAGPKLVQADPVLSELASTGDASVAVGRNLGPLLDTFDKTKGFQYLTQFIYNSVGTANGFDSFGHFLRSNLQLTACVEIAPSIQGSCEAFFQDAGTTQPTTKKKKKKKKKVKKAKLRAVRGGSSVPQSPIPPVDIPAIPNIPQLIPGLSPDEGTTAAPPSGATPPDTTTPNPPAGDQPPADQQGNTRAKKLSMSQTALFLRFLLGRGA